MMLLMVKHILNKNFIINRNVLNQKRWIDSFLQDDTPKQATARKSWETKKQNYIFNQTILVPSKFIIIHTLKKKKHVLFIYFLFIK